MKDCETVNQILIDAFNALFASARRDAYLAFQQFMLHRFQYLKELIY